MKCIIAGATGLIGQQLILRLLYENHSVVALTRNIAATKLTKSENLKFLLWDGKLLSKWKNEISGADAVVNLCGENISNHRWNKIQKNKLISSRIHPTQALVQAMAEARIPPKSFINASAVGCYGNSSEMAVDEATQRGSGFLSELCESWESHALKASSLGIRTITARFGVILDPSGGMLSKMILPFQIGLGHTPGDGSQYLSWIHHQDAVQSLLFMLKNTKIAGPVNITSPHPLPMKQFTRLLAKIMHRPHFLHVPAWFFRWLLGEMASLLLEGQRALPKKLIEAGFRFDFPEIELALNDLLKGKTHDA